MDQIKKEIEAMRRASREMRKSIRNNPTEAKRWLIRVGILTKDGKRLAVHYR